MTGILEIVILSASGEKEIIPGEHAAAINL